MKRIGIIGSGNMGRAIGIRLAQLGHSVTFGARRLEQAEEAAKRAGGRASAGSNDDAVKESEVLIWTIREADPARVLADPETLSGKIVVDLNNRDYGNEVRNGVWFDIAIAEALQTKAPEAKVVKAWNTIAMEAFDTNPEDLRTAGAQTFIAGRDTAAKSVVAALSDELGFTAIDLGADPVAFRAAEALGDVIRYIMIDGGKGGQAHLSLTQLPEPQLGAIGARSQSNYK